MENLEEIEKAAKKVSSVLVERQRAVVATIKSFEFNNLIAKKTKIAKVKKEL
jgi:hypothetical protein